MTSSESHQRLMSSMKNVERNGEITTLETELQELQQPLLCQDERDICVEDKEESYDVENPCIQLPSSKEGKSGGLPSSIERKLRRLPTLSYECCIYRVPKVLREQKPAVYTPQVVSIGPLHHGKEYLKVMEEHKRRYLKNFLARSNISIKDCTEIVKENENMLRAFYAETIRMQSDEFVEMILVDAAFIIELLWIDKKSRWNFIDGRIGFRPHDVRMDMLMLENQIPYFIIEKIYDAAKLKSSSSEEQLWQLSIIERFYNCFKQFFPAEHNSNRLLSSTFMHFLDLFRNAYQPTQEPVKRRVESWKKLTLTTLEQAGVKFQVLDPSKNNMFDIKFKDGILSLPKIVVNWGTEVLLRNLVAFEQCNCETNFLADYAIFLDFLIDAEKDIEILVENGVLENWSSDNKTPLNLFNGLATSCSFDPGNFFFAGLWKELDDYYMDPWHKWKAILQQDYFSTPWATISVMAGAVLLILTALQTVWSITHP